MHLKYLVATALGVAAGGALAAPQFSTCWKSTKYKDLVVSEPYDLPARMATGQTCEAKKVGGCQITMSKGHTVTVEHSFSVGLTGGLDLSKIFSAGLEAGYSVSWSTSDETTAATTVICEEAKYTCGIMVWPKVVKITGKAADDGNCPNVDNTKWYDFEVVAPYMEETEGPESLSVSARFSACYIDCADVESCNKAMENGVEQCPSDLAPGQWTNHFGGKPGYITPEDAEENRERILAEQEGQE